MNTKHMIPDPGDLTLISQAELNGLIDLHRMFLEGRKGGARLVLNYRDLSHLTFKESDLRQADFTASLLIEANLSNSTCQGASFFACDLRNANLQDCNLSRADFRGAYMSGSNLTGADLTGADFREGKIMKRGDKGELVDRKRSGGKGARTILSGAKLTRANLTGIQAIATDFSDVDLSHATVKNSDLKNANFFGANLTNTDFTGANMTFSNLRSAVIPGTLLQHIEKQGLETRGVLTEADMGEHLENLGKTLPELLEEHTLWVSSAGRAGRQLDLSGYDLRSVIDLRKFPLTAIRAIGANFLSQNLHEAELQSAVFDKSDFRDCKMQDADLRGSSFKYAHMARVNLSNAKLCPLEFIDSDGASRLKRTEISGSSLRYASLKQGDLRDCIMMGVDLTNAILVGCDLRRADLTGAILKGAIFDDCNLKDAIIDMDNL